MVDKEPTIQEWSLADTGLEWSLYFQKDTRLSQYDYVDPNTQYYRVERKAIREAKEAITNYLIAKMQKVDKEVYPYHAIFAMMGLWGIYPLYKLDQARHEYNQEKLDTYYGVIPHARKPIDPYYLEQWSQERYIMRYIDDDELEIYSGFLTYTAIQLVNKKLIYDKNIQEKLQQLREKNRDKRYKWNLTNFTYTLVALRELGDILEQEPLIVHDPTQLRPPRERTLADYRDEVINKLSTLASYTAMCQLLQADGNTETVLIRCLKG